MGIFKKNEEKMPFRLDNSHDYKDTKYAIINAFPEEARLQLTAWDSKNPNYRLLGTAHAMQNELIKDEAKVTLSRTQLAMIYAAISDLATHLPEDTPDGVYNYSYSNISGVSRYILEQLNK